MFDLLQKYKKVVEIGNLTKASKEIFISQPALSFSIKNLENQLGCKLLIRSKNGVRPTELGKLVYKYSNRISLEFKNLKALINEKNEKLESNINMGMIDNVGLIFVSKVYKKFLDKYSQINLQIQVNNSKRLIEEVEKGNLDFGIITKPNKRLPIRFMQKGFACERMNLVASTEVAKKINRISHLNGINFISYNSQSTTHKLIQRILIKKKVHVNYIAYSSSPNFIIQMVKQGSGIAVLPENLIRGNLKRLEFKNLRFERKLSLIYLKDTYLPKTTIEFIEKLKTSYKS